MSIKLLGPADYVVMPWRNGLGHTTELLRADGPDGFLWRLSRAAVTADGPFSLFPNVDRILLLLSGNGLVFDFGNGRPVRLTERFAPITFAGDAPVTCGLVDGACEDFNIMVDRRFYTAVAEVHGSSSVIPSSGMSFFYNLEGFWTIRGVKLPRGGLAVVEDEHQVGITGAGAVLEVKLAAT